MATATPHASSGQPETMSKTKVTDQLTPKGRQIEAGSFAIVDQEAGPHSYSPEQWQVVRRMIHASADFEFNGLTAFHPQAIEAGLAALKGGAAIVSDVEMITVGVSKARCKHFGVTVHQFISDEDVIALAKAENTTRAVQAMRKAQRFGLLEGAILAFGNAPTALLEALRLIQEEGAKPALVIGMPVGFVSAAESKEQLMELEQTPWITIQGRKGGSPLVVSAIHALMTLAEQTS